jgi:hypothetical protein
LKNREVRGKKGKKRGKKEGFGSGIRHNFEVVK